MKISKIRDVKDPVRANQDDAGIDFFIPNDSKKITLYPNEGAIIPSGIKVNVPSGHALIAFNKSGIATKKGLQVGACVVDCGYQGEIHIHLTNTGIGTQTLHAGDKIVQFVLVQLGSPDVEVVQERFLYNAVSNRGTGGFGSTGTK
jgi:dUTP pyrophosphatase